MAVADYFNRNAVAISQALSGLDESRLDEILKEVCIGITIGIDAGSDEGRAMLDLLVRILARLYPTIVFRADGNADLVDEARSLATRINPLMDLAGTPTVEIVLGSTKTEPWTRSRIFAGSNGWYADVSTCNPCAVGKSNNPFGAGAAACLAAAALFRHVFLSELHLDQDLHVSVLDFDSPTGASLTADLNLGDIVLAGAGAIGNSATWALQRTATTGSLSVVDHESIDLGNLQRYVMAERNDEGKPKAYFLSNKFNGALRAIPIECRIAEFFPTKKYRVDKLLLALDSKQDRCAAQASLPRWVANAWTQPGDLGVSTHDFLNGACVQCMYLPDGQIKSEDQIIAEVLGVKEMLQQIRDLLYSNSGTPLSLLEAIALSNQVAIEKLLPFQDRPIRDLYREGFCGGAVIPLTQAGSPNGDVHVPLAHQSALAGIMLAASLIRESVADATIEGVVTQYDVLKPQQRFHSYQAAKDPRGICICQDSDYQLAYKRKYLA